MCVIAFDTCFDACSVAIARELEGARVVTGTCEAMATGQAERLLPMLGEVLDEAGLAHRDVTGIAVTTGPGTFTGTRIGVAAARGLALALGVPIVTASTLEVMALAAAADANVRRRLDHLGEASELVVAVDARRGEIYRQRFAARSLSPISHPEVIGLADVDASPHDAIIVGSGAAALVAAMSAAMASSGAAGVHEAHLSGLLPDARFLALTAHKRQPVAHPAPLYLRAPDAKPQAGASLARAPA
ncbi:MAG: tRNA (adenosine(37)-N6)-threonylcarbamoyltransferase complex dimerization subunit type 1 TsaB [Hyphomicrobiaceae bacterium]|nr:tRNA (adenosine(37)-N6)-threonylcarbamoyltransferase complex dimerization subunit type 1 TsaB [Hyphomicrobiaceae bacterium]